MNRKEALVAGGVAVVLAFGWHQFVWQSQGKSAQKATADKEAAEQQAAKLKGQVALLQRTKSELAEQQATVERINMAIPEVPDQSSLIKLLQARAGELGVTIGTISNGQVAAPQVTAPPNGEAPPRANEMTLTMTLHGDYDAVVQYVHALSEMPRLVVVDSVSMQVLQSQAKPGEVVKSDQISVNVSARVFTTAALPAAPGATTTTAAKTTAGSSATTAAADTKAQP